MNQLFSSFLDRLAERFTAILAGVISSRVEGLQAAAQADQQSQLEDLARKYEAEGKDEIARTLRKRAVRLTSTDLAAEAVEVMETVAGERLKVTGTPQSPPSDNLQRLPDFSAPTRPRKKRRGADNDASGPDVTGATS